MEKHIIEGLDLRYLDAFRVCDMINQPIHITTPDGIVRFVNLAWSAVYGIPQQEALGKSIKELMTLSDYYVSLPEIQNFDSAELKYTVLEKPTNRSAADFAIEQKKPITMLNQTPARNKVIVTATPILDEAGEVVMVFTLIQDLTMLAGWHDFMQNTLEKVETFQKELANLRSNIADSLILGNSHETKELRRLISIIAPSDASILIIGESGTGKEVAAKQIYAESQRCDKPFVTVNCSAIPENLLESELFGHEKGAFTGATSTKLGLFEVANHGTILLDEIGEFPLQLQPKLLRALQEREIRRVGGNKTIPIDVRVISATNQDLKAMVTQGLFRADLYYRLNVFPLPIPPLRERPDDIPILAATFLQGFNKKYGKNKTFTHQAIAALQKYSWPGNVRELENLIERLAIVGDEPSITADQVSYLMEFRLSGPGKAAPQEEEQTLKAAVDALEKRMITEAIRQHGSTYKAAEVLGTSQSTIVRKMQMLGIHKEGE
ncbi:MAG: sigma 54-interacting transcriptional regulator [Clostridia bacterium]|nr:sigma 54-interacting transcriptional regulator [Clostridia bacterium]